MSIDFLNSVSFDELPGIYAKIKRKPNNEDYEKVINFAFYNKQDQIVPLPKDVRIMCVYEQPQRYCTEDFSDKYTAAGGFDITEDEEALTTDWYVVYKKTRLLCIYSKCVQDFYLDFEKDDFHESDSE